MPLSHRRAHRLVVVLVALAVGLLTTVVTGAGAPDSGSPPSAAVHIQDDGPRNPEAQAATGDTNAMLAVVQDALDCLRENGFHPGDPRVNGQNVVTPDWNPAPDSLAGRATSDCFFPVR